MNSCFPCSKLTSLMLARLPINFSFHCVVFVTFTDKLIRALWRKGRWNILRRFLFSNSVLQWQFIRISIFNFSTTCIWCHDLVGDNISISYYSYNKTFYFLWNVLNSERNTSYSFQIWKKCLFPTFLKLFLFVYSRLRHIFTLF